MKPTRSTIAEVSLRAIAQNFSEIRKRVGKSTKVMAVVKANAYGHGDTEVGSFLEKQKADYFGVAFAEEGLRLRKSGIRKPILVFTLAAKSQLSLYTDSKLEATVASMYDVQLLGAQASKVKRTIPVHLKIETGMNRIGARRQDIKEIARVLGRERRLEVKGAFTHLATAEEKDTTFARQQLSEFQKTLEEVKKIGFEPEIVHCANSAAIQQFPESYYSMVRPGITLYGYYPSRTMEQTMALTPAMSIKTTVSLVKWVNAGESVSYGRRFIAQRKIRIATLPIGYADGYSRLLSNKCYALIQGQRFPVVGTICMDQLMVDVGNADVRVGDEAVLIGKQGEYRITAWDLAERIGTVPYEVLCSISARVPRVYVKS
ncbi:MAG: alanine racemase [Ignavibacteriales bacterium]|nr:alanine racemase [Ignavibacteriales bacterium]